MLEEIIQLIIYLKKKALHEARPHPLPDQSDIFASHRRLVEDCGLFDALWYTRRHPEIQQVGLSPLDHYLSFGWRSRWSPGPDFDADWYLKNYPDVESSGQQPLLHYLLYGKSEGRHISAANQEESEAKSKKCYGDSSSSGTSQLNRFLRLVEERRPHKVLEVGTKRSIATEATHHMRHFPCTERKNYIMVDIDEGIDVDVIADLHNLPDAWTETFDAFFAAAVFEHLQRPWIAAKEVARILKPGGICYIGTHQTFPIHGFPSDFFRFSKEALRLIFDDAGLKVIDCNYKYRAKIIPPPDLLDSARVDAWNSSQEAWIWVDLVAERL